MISLFTSIGLWRQQLRPETRVHGIITDGGTAANIIPARTTGRFMVRAADQATYDGMRVALRGPRPGGRARHRLRGRGRVLGAIDRDAQQRGADTAVVRTAWPPRVWPTVDPVAELSGSSDMGNVSLAMPAIHPCIAICDEGVAGHSTEFRDAAATPRADDGRAARGHARGPDRVGAAGRPGAWSRPRGRSTGVADPAGAGPSASRRAPRPLLRPRPAG